MNSFRGASFSQYCGDDCFYFEFDWEAPRFEFGSGVDSFYFWVSRIFSAGRKSAIRMALICCGDDVVALVKPLMRAENEIAFS